MRLAQETAFKKKKDILVVWRNYKLTVQPAGPKFNTTELREHLLLALREILKIHNMKSFSPEEESIFQALAKESRSSSTTQTDDKLIKNNATADTYKDEKKKKKMKGSYTDIEVIKFNKKLSVIHIDITINFFQLNR